MEIQNQIEITKALIEGMQERQSECERFDVISQGEKLLEYFVSKCTEIEAPYFDKNGKQIEEFAVIKIFHFKGVNEQGRGRKNYYMYKWVRLVERNGKKWWTALHLSNDSGDYFHLRSIANSERVITDTEIVQQH